MMFKKSTIQLLRFPFSFFLMPVFWFSLSCVDTISIPRAALLFCIIHFLLYPSSNGYNSYMDRDTESIGGIEHPMEPEKELYYITLLMDLLAIGLTFLFSLEITLLISCYIVCSRLYSYRGVRLKQYPITGYLTVIFNQGGLLFGMVYIGASAQPVYALPWYALVAACFLIGGFYPITQIYQHAADKKDGVQTISMLLGKKGTFIFCVIIYIIAFIALFTYYRMLNQLTYFLVLQIFFLPVLVYFMRWAISVWQDEAKANFANTMRMNWLASACTNLGFITILIMHQLG